MNNGFYTYLEKNVGVLPAHLEQLTEIPLLKEVKRGDVLLSNGQVCDHIFFVIKGILRFYSIDNHGREHILQFASQNWWMADRNNLCDHQPSEYFIDAVEESTIMLINQTFIEKASAISIEFRSFHEKILQKRIKTLYHRINLLIAATAKERYLDFLQTYPDLLMRVPQWMVASYLGVTPEGLSRVRKEISQTKSSSLI
jgi:CRP-like cAMP-binding protein